jgi:hypothetical protein
MLIYQTHRIPLVQDPSLAFLDRLQASLLAAPEATKALLDGWIEGRSSEVDLTTLRVRMLEGDEASGAVEIGFDESSWAACRLETLRAPHRGRVPYRREGDVLLMESLPRNAFEERHDEL